MIVRAGEHAIARERPTVQVGYLPFGDAYICRLPFVENSYIVSNGTTGLSSMGYSYWGNNMYDPRIELGGLQPFQFDTLATAYTSYRVYETHVELTFSNPTEDGLIVGYRVRNGNNTVATSGQTIGRLAEMANVEMAYLNNSGSQIKSFKFCFRTADVCGITEVHAENAIYSGTFDGSILPIDQTVIEPFAFSTVSGDNTTVRYTIKITYHARCYGRITLPQS